MYSAIARHILYPVAERLLGTNLLKHSRELEETQWWPPEQLRELQNEKLRALIKHAYENVPYYHRVFQERGLADRDIRTIEDLSKLPVLTKDDIRRNFQALMANDFKKWRPVPAATGGSTGEPLRYYITLDTASINWAGMFRGWGWAGYRLGDKRATLGGSSLVPDKPPTFLERARRIGERNLPLSAAGMDENKMAAYVSKLKKYKPKFLYGYPSAIYTFADYLAGRGINDIRPQAVFTTAEVLLPHHRQGIEEQFGCKVFDQYGCYDGGAQALECPAHHGLHISAEKAVMEFVDGNKTPVAPGKVGEILATDLHNYAMPFIRYAIGDMGTLSTKPCPCGRGLPLLSSLEGRTTDRIVFSNGVVLSGPALTLVFKDCRIKQYQVIQKAGDRLLVKVVKGEGYTERDTEHFLGIIKAHAGKSIGIETEFVDEILPTKAGKYKFIISDYQNQESIDRNYGQRNTG
jgi:phenylacetate-CoA ligase